MRPVQAQFVTVCQQLLALGVVLAVITPAAGVLSLEIVGAPSRSGDAPAPLTALRSATVPTEVVEANVTEVALTTPSGSARALVGETVVGRGSVATDRVTSRPQEVSGYTAVGVTWAVDEVVEEDQIALQIRTREGDGWTDWSVLEYHDDHAPDAGSPEAATARPGTDPLFVGDVDAVQIKARTTDALPDDLSLAIIEPGRPEATESAAPAASTTSAEQEFEDRSGESDALALQAAATAAQPTVFTRAQWGADESIRNKSALRYGSVSAGFVHHTVNANDYTEAQVPGIIRSIYAYHVKSRGWSDIGYNFLVDRFGRIWEGRFGGIDKPVVGAHTYGYNDYSFAMSAIGNYDIGAAPDVMVRAFGALFAWKLGLHGVNPASMSQQVGRKTFAAINGHSDADSTACPGRYLYAKISTIRSYASTAAPAPAPPPAPVPETPLEITDPAPQSNLVGAAYPDLVVRRASDGRGLILPTGGLTSFSKATEVSAKGWSNRPEVLITPDVTGDGVLDLVSTSEQGVLRIRPGKGNGKFKATSKVITATEDHTLMTAVGDVDKDGRNDLVARHKGRMVALLGTPKGGFKRKELAKGMGSYTQFIGVGDQTGDGSPDVFARDGKGRLFLFAGKGSGAFGGRATVPGSWSSYNRVTGGADFNGDGRGDLVARTAKGKIFIHVSHGDGSFSQAIGPAANVRALRSLTSAGNLVGDAAPDLVGVKGNSLVVVPHKGTFDLGAPIDTGMSFAGANAIISAGDWDRDGAGDVITRGSDGFLRLYRGDNTGLLTGPIDLGGGFGEVTGLMAAGDVTGDGFPDLLGMSGGALAVWPGTGSGISPGRMVAARTIARAGLPSDLSTFDWVIPVSDIKGAGTGDYLVRQPSTGYLYVYTGTLSGVAPPRWLGEGLGAYDLAG